MQVTDAVDESEIISFGSVCAMHLGVTSSVVSERSELQALVAILCLVFALFLIPYELHARILVTGRCLSQSNTKPT